MARLRVVRSDETLALPQRAQIRIGGRPAAELGAGEEHVVDLPAGPVVVTAATRPGATAATLSLTLVAGRSYRVRIVLEPDRFPPYDGPLSPLRFVRESIAAPHDDRRPMFRLQAVPETEPAPRRGTARRAEAELDAATGVLD